MTLAYWDSLSGLVPCRILAVGDWTDGSSQARVKLTGSKGPYKRGELHTLYLRRVVPRTAIRRTKYATYIRPYSWPAINAKPGA